MKRIDIRYKENILMFKQKQLYKKMEKICYELILQNLLYKQNLADYHFGPDNTVSQTTS